MALSNNLTVLILLALSFVAAVVGKSLVNKRRANPAGLPLPPGPKPLPFIGNLRDLPRTQQWVTYTDWSEKYGEIVYTNIMGSDIIILNSLQATTDLFEKRSHIYSSRPVIPMRDLLGWDWLLGFMPYDDQWRKHRKCLHQRLKPEAALAYRPIQMARVHEFLRNLVASPEDFRDHYRNMSASIIMATTYGYNIAPNNDPFVEKAEQAITRMSFAVFPGIATMMALPILRHLPSCLSFLPGVSSMRLAEECRVLTNEMLDHPLALVKTNMRNGIATPSIITELLENNVCGSKEEDEMIRALGGTLYATGADTVVCAIGTFFYSAAVNPEAQKKAQKEIDSVIGTDRLPTFEDRPSLPYIDAFYREVMRWRPALPLGMTHASTENDDYKGYFIPKGATLISNVWAMAHDGSKYANPDLFQPERFLNPDGRLNDDSAILTYGFGRRVCVGRHAADSTLWATFVSVLAAFNVGKAKDEAGNEVEIPDRFSDGLTSHVLPFRCSITPRSPDARRLIEETKNGGV